MCVGDSICDYIASFQEKEMSTNVYATHLSKFKQSLSTGNTVFKLK